MPDKPSRASASSRKGRKSAKKPPCPKWTPGPWENVRDDFIEAANGTVVVEQINNELGLLADEEITANADLIAAAPALYEALEYAYPFLRYCQHEHMGDIDGNESEKLIALAKASAALQKARGKEGAK